ncbi:MAG: hypothetical protein JNM12_07915 [Alphaproteobacteria bacterium]|nr:hypothetical protein [Alphaproteobacteria bacterium]
MRISIEIKDEKKTALIHHLRGKKTAKEFITMCVDAGLGVALQQMRDKQKIISSNMPVLRLSAANPAFKMLSIEAVNAALKEKKSSNPINNEVARLVAIYTRELRDIAAKNGNKLPRTFKTSLNKPIEEVALKITAHIVWSMSKKTVKSS